MDTDIHSISLPLLLANTCWKIEVNSLLDKDLYRSNCQLDRMDTDTGYQLQTCMITGRNVSSPIQTPIPMPISLLQWIDTNTNLSDKSTIATRWYLMSWTMEVTGQDGHNTRINFRLGTTKGLYRFQLPSHSAREILRIDSDTVILER